MYNFEKNKMILRKEYYEITGKKPEDNIGAYADYLERKLVKNHGVSHDVSDQRELIIDIVFWMFDNWNARELETPEMIADRYINK